ncbi:MAG: hypothetical protein LBI13_05685 [Streptococcaceae bacterium]|nr:hypothetical protein [Streptococcaceae bacterium]
MEEEEDKRSIYSRATRRLAHESEIHSLEDSDSKKNERDIEATRFGRNHLRKSEAISHKKRQTIFGGFSARAEHDTRYNDLNKSTHFSNQRRDTLSETRLDHYRRTSNELEKQQTANGSTIEGFSSIHPLENESAATSAAPTLLSVADFFTPYHSTSSEFQTASTESVADESETRAYSLSSLTSATSAYGNSADLSQKDEGYNNGVNDENYNYESKSSSSKLSSLDYLKLLVIAAITSMTFYSFPFFNRVATGTTGQNLYAAFAMNKGVTPYLHLFSSAGPLFYLVNQVGFGLGNTVALWVLEVLTIWLSGITIFKIFDEIIENKKIGLVLSAFSIFMIGGLSLGGDQAILFALPFALYGFRVLNRHFIDDESAKDEVVLLYGAAGAIASLFYPVFLLLFIIGAFGIIGHNVIYGHWGRGFYQFLCGLMGVIVVCAIVGYYTLTNQMFFPVIDQAFIYPFTHLNFSLSGFLNLGISLLIVLFSGLLASWLFGFYYASQSAYKLWSSVLLIAATFSLLLVSFQHDYSPANALVILPFVVMFMGLHIDRNESGRLTTRKIIWKYLQSSSFFPVLALILVLAFPFGNKMVNSGLISSEKSVASYIDKNSSAQDQVVLISDNNMINYLAKRVSKVTMPPSYYPTSYSQTFDIDLTSSKAKFIVIQTNKGLSSTVQSMLKSSYTQMKFADSNFKVYKIK